MHVAHAALTCFVLSLERVSERMWFASARLCCLLFQRLANWQPIMLQHGKVSVPWHAKDHEDKQSCQLKVQSGRCTTSVQTTQKAISG